MKLILVIFLLAMTCAVAAPTPPPVSPEYLMVRKTTALSRAVELMADAAPLSAVPTSKHIPKPHLRAPLAQEGGSCTGFSFTNWLNTDTEKPWYNESNDLALQIYAWARDHDDIKSNDGNPEEGTYTWMVEKRLRQLKYIDQTDNSFVQYEKDLRKQIQTVGPVVLSMLWYSGFDVPDDNGGIHLAGEIRGGHAILCFWFEPASNGLPARYYLFQSWKGYAPYDKFGQIVWIPASDMRRLLNRGGYGLAPTKNPKRVK